MPKLNDLTGKVFDKLTVLEKAPSRARHVYWKCRCECGNIIDVSAESLKKYTTHNCGCVKLQAQKEKENIKKNKLNYLVGQRFGKLVVEARTDERQNRSIVWKCKCDCGNYKNVPTHLLVSNHTQSCGCLIREVQGNDLTNQRFGKLIALYPCDYKKKNSIVWHCRCDCGNEYDVESYSLRAGLTQSCGCITSSIGETNIQKILQENDIEHKKEYTVKEIGNLRFDFALLENEKVVRLIEFDGIQHFTSRSGVWNDTEDDLQKRQERDNRKNKWAIDNNIPLVRIPYWERDKITLEMILSSIYEVRGSRSGRTP